MVETALSCPTFISTALRDLSQPTTTGTPTPSKRRSSIPAIIGLLAITVLSLGFAGYTSLNPHSVTVTQQQFFTNFQTQYSTQTITSVSAVTSVSTVTAASVASNQAVTVTSPGYGYGYSQYYNCGMYGCTAPSLGAYGSLCQSTGQNSTVQCSGILSTPGNGCTQLAIPYTNPDILESTAYQFYTLRNAPSTLPSAGSWITVTGTLGQGFNPGTNGAVCPADYINVVSVSP